MSLNLIKLEVPLFQPTHYKDSIRDRCHANHKQHIKKDVIGCSEKGGKIDFLTYEHSAPR